MIQQAINQGLSVASLLFTQTPMYKEALETTKREEEYNKGTLELKQLFEAKETVEDELTKTKTPKKGEATTKTIEAFEPLPGLAQRGVELTEQRLRMARTPEERKGALAGYNYWLKEQQNIQSEQEAIKAELNKKAEATAKRKETRAKATAAATAALEEAQEIRRGGNM
jgi:hypothetical protein